MIDIHCSPGWALHLDSDILFFKKPQQFIEAFKNKTAVYMKDMLTNSYYVDDEKVRKDNFDISCLNHVNGGIIAYNNDLIDYTDLEHKACILLDKYMDKSPARIEQTLMSYILYKQNTTALDDRLYKIYYNHPIDTTNVQIAKHYIFKAKLPFFTTEWKKTRH